MTLRSSQVDGRTPFRVPRRACEAWGEGWSLPLEELGDVQLFLEVLVRQRPATRDGARDRRQRGHGDATPGRRLRSTGRSGGRSLRRGVPVGRLGRVRRGGL